MKRVIAMLLVLLTAMPAAAGAQPRGRPGGAWKGGGAAPAPRPDPQRHRQLSQEERRQLHRDLDQADQEIYRRKGGR